MRRIPNQTKELSNLSSLCGTIKTVVPQNVNHNHFVRLGRRLGRSKHQLTKPDDLSSKLDVMVPNCTPQHSYGEIGGGDRTTAQKLISQLPSST